MKVGAFRWITHRYHSSNSAYANLNFSSVPAILHKSVYFPKHPWCYPVFPSLPYPSVSSTTKSSQLFLLDVSYSLYPTPLLLSRVDVHPHSSGWWYLACLPVSTLAAAPVNSFHCCYPKHSHLIMSFYDQHELVSAVSCDSVTRLVSFCFSPPPLCSSNFELLGVPLTCLSSSACMTLYILLLCPNCGHAHPLLQVFCLPELISMWLFPRGTVVGAFSLTGDASLSTDAVCYFSESSVTSKVGIYILVVVFKVLNTLTGPSESHHCALPPALMVWSITFCVITQPWKIYIHFKDFNASVLNPLFSISPAVLY